ncbi:LysR family transcriptional regulator [Nostoc sp. 3335mG]|nr:LysR family transcriptional regulator [Nostoc sp. 3335mG]
MTANYQHLRAFHAIAVEGGVSRAARRLNVSQPTLSQQLKALEARHGVSLFEGRKSPLKLTSAGRDLFALTQRLFATASDIDEMLGETTSLAGGVLRLGSDSPYYAARVIDLFRLRHPQASIAVRMGNAREVMQWLSAAQIDAALASDPPGDAAFSYDPLFTDSLTCGLPVGHRLLAHQAIPVAALADEVMLAREPTSKTRAFTERALMDAGVTPAAALELQGRETIREAIALGLGIGVFFSSECPPDPRIVYRPLDTGQRDYPLRGFLLCQSERKRSGLMRALKSVVVEIRAEEEGETPSNVVALIA